MMPLTLTVLKLCDLKDELSPPSPGYNTASVPRIASIQALGGKGTIKATNL